MGEVIQLPKRNVQHASTEQLEQNKLAKERQELALHTNEIIRGNNTTIASQAEQIKVALEAILMLMHLCEMCNVPDGPVLDFAKEALAKLGD